METITKKQYQQEYYNKHREYKCNYAKDYRLRKKEEREFLKAKQLFEKYRNKLIEL